MLRALTISLCLIAVTSVVDYSFELSNAQAQRRGKNNSGGQNARKRPGRNKRIEKREDQQEKRDEWEKKREEWRKQREAAKDAAGGNGGKRGDVDLKTIPEWWMQRASTWMTASEQNMPMLLAFVSEETSLDASFWVDEEIAAYSRKDVLFVMCIEGHSQVGMDADEDSEAPAEKPAPSKTDEDKDGSGDAEDAEQDGDKGKADEKKAKGPDFFGGEEVERDWSESEKDLHAKSIESSFVPASKLWYANLRKAYEVEKNNTFVLVDPYGVEIERYTSKPSEKKLASEVEDFVEDREKLEDELQELLDEALEADESGKTKDALKALGEIFEAGVAGHLITNTAAEIYFELLDDARKELAEARAKEDKNTIKSLERTFKGTDLDKEFEQAAGEDE